MGVYYEGFLISSVELGVQQNHIADAAIVWNEGHLQRGEWIVNCNESFAQVISPDNSKVTFNPDEHPPSALRIPFDLWQIVCRNVRAQSFEEDRVHSPSGNVNAAGRTFRLSRPFPDLPMTNLVRLDEATNSPEDLPLSAFVYCSPSVPTVFWTDSDELHEMVIEDFGNRFDADRFGLSVALLNATCDIDRGVCPGCDTATEASVLHTEGGTLKYGSPSRSELRELYLMYMVADRCARDGHYLDATRVAGYRYVLTQVQDEFPEAEQGVLWDEALEKFGTLFANTSGKGVGSRKMCVEMEDFVIASFLPLSGSPQKP